MTAVVFPLTAAGLSQRDITEINILAPEGKGQTLLPATLVRPSPWIFAQLSTVVVRTTIKIPKTAGEGILHSIYVSDSAGRSADVAPHMPVCGNFPIGSFSIPARRHVERVPLSSVAVRKC